jgi:4-coumarate--CoA ligase
MWLGNFTCALTGFDLETFCQQCDKYKATITYIVPPIALLLVSSDIPRKYDFSSLESMITAAAPLKKALQQKVEEIFPKTKIIQAFGMSECASALIQHEKDAEHVGTCGRLLPSTEARIVNPTTGQDVKMNEEGEVWLRGPQVVMGYLNDEAATRAAFSESGNWLKTGDIMKRDSNDNFWVTDRLKEMIKYKGLQIAPSEIEDLLVQHEKVIDAAVCGVYVEELASEVPLAYVSLREDCLLSGTNEIQRTLEQVRNWVDGKVAGYKKLRGGVHHLQILPKNSTGKILRKELPIKKKGGRVAVL